MSHRVTTAELMTRLEEVNEEKGELDWSIVDRDFEISGLADSPTHLH
jgi:hypothetical protein